MERPIHSSVVGSPFCKAGTGGGMHGVHGIQGEAHPQGRYGEPLLQSRCKKRAWGYMEVVHGERGPSAGQRTGMGSMHGSA